MSAPARSRVGDALEAAALLLTGYAVELHYNLVGHLASLRGMDLGPLLRTPLDGLIPYDAAGVWFYQFALFVPAVVVLLVLARIGLDLPALRRILLTVVILLAVQYALYLLLPASAQAVRRPVEALGSGLSARLVDYQYRLATVWCAWPSLHVSGGWFFFRLLARHYPLLRWFYLAWFVGMVWGALAIKIHYVWDVVAGILIGELAYRFVLTHLERRGIGRWVWRSTMWRGAVHVALLAGVLGLLPVLIRLSGFRSPLVPLP